MTKLVIPPTYHKNIIPRPRLYHLLDHGIQGPLTLVTAPAGSGKTTLVGEWLRQRELRAAWLSLENADNDPSRFWRYIVAALAQLSPAINDQFGSGLQSLPSEALEAALTALINILAALPQDLILVLDDYHTLDNPAIHHSLQFLLNHLPPQLHLCIITRSEPPLGLARMRVQGKVTMLQAGDLDFTTAETELLLTQTMGLTLAPDDLAVIHRRIEGWAAGLHLLALSLSGLNDPAALHNTIHGFSGCQPHVLQYLTDEVLRQQPPDVLEFLLTTSVLERLHADLCDAVTGQHHGHEMLRLLMATNLFLHPLYEHWYRYSTLFAELLRHRLYHTEPALIPELHQRASTWYEQHGLIPDAIKHAPERFFNTLSEREHAVLRLMATGMSNQEIARALVVTVSTVKTHLNNIYAKLQVHTRLQAVTRAHDLGLLPQTTAPLVSTTPVHMKRSTTTARRSGQQASGSSQVAAEPKQRGTNSRTGKFT